MLRPLLRRTVPWEPLNFIGRLLHLTSTLSEIKGGFGKGGERSSWTDEEEAWAESWQSREDYPLWIGTSMWTSDRFHPDPQNTWTKFHRGFNRLRPTPSKPCPTFGPPQVFCLPRLLTEGGFQTLAFSTCLPGCLTQPVWLKKKSFFCF